TGNVTDENCGDGTGAIDVITTGGNMPLSFAWDSGETTQDLSNLSEGVYNLVVTDNFGCTVNFNGTAANITGGLSVTIASVTDENCGQSDGAIDATITGTGIVSTVWESGQTSEDLTGVIAGTYVLTVTNDVGCSATGTGTVANLTGTLAMTFNNVGDENCINGQGFVDIEVSGTGPFTYLWSDGQTAQDAVGLSAGTYSVTIADGVGCQLTQSFQVNNINATNIDVNGLITDAFCTSVNGEIDATVNGGISPYTFSWDNAETTEDITNLAAGDYVITVTDGANCQVTEIFTVGSQNSGLGFMQIQIQDDFCGQGNGEIIIFTNGIADGYYIDGVNNGGPIISNLSTGTYTISISDNFGCTADSVVTVGNQATFNVTDVSVNESCSSSNGSIDISVIGGGTYTYAWDSGETTEDLTNVTAGTYTVTTTDGGSPCSMDYMITIGNDVTFEIAGLTTDDYCEGDVGAIDQTIVSGTGLIFSWANGPTTEDLTGLSAGTYTCTVTDPAPGGCVETFEYFIDSTSNGMVISVLVMDEECIDGLGEINLTVSGGSGTKTYVWDNSAVTEDLTGLSAGNYEVTVTDPIDNCSLTEMYTVNNVNTVFNGGGVVSNATCATCLDGVIDVTLSTATTYTYVWDNSETTEDLTELNPGTYTLVATSAEGCDTTMVFDVMNIASLDELEGLRSSLSIQPNPASAQFYVSYELPAGQTGEVLITDALGKLIRKMVVSGQNELLINSVDFETGMYFVTLQSRKVSKVERLVILKN
ncbi:MAG: T9SS type A sorting domain-containing protein, partial [Crocinitomicaceae bacterium]|nr:T9SS type A sorting domain-containing protein [Crocinitomicaceae bacterium]